MNSRTSIALTAVAMLLSASLVMAQGSTQSATGTPAKAAKPAAGAVAKTKMAAGTAQTKMAATATQTKMAAGTAQTKMAAGTAQTKMAAGTEQTKMAASTAQNRMAASATQAKASAGSLVDLNTASKADLMKLPGVGEAISAKIIAGRPWSSKAQLLSKGLVSKPAYDKLSPMVIAKQAAAKK